MIADTPNKEVEKMKEITHVHRDLNATEEDLEEAKAIAAQMSTEDVQKVITVALN